MPRPSALVVLWVVAAVVAVGAAWQGVAVVSDRVTDDRPAPLTAAEVRRIAGGEVDGAAGGEAGQGPATGGAAEQATTTSSGSAGSPSSSGSGTDSGSPTAATAPTTSAGSGASGSGAAAVTRTYNLVGGSVALRFAPEGVTVSYATPNPGFRVEVEPAHGNGVRVEFESDTHRSRVDGWWEAGPQDRVREEER